MILHQLPLITIQHDFPQVIKDIQNGLISAEDIWISCYLKNSNQIKSLHGKVRVTSVNLNYNNNSTKSIIGDDGDGDQQVSPLDSLPCLEPRHGIHCRWAPHASFQQLHLIVSCESLSIEPTLVSFPFRIMKNVQSNGIECMDVTGEWIVTGGKNGNLRLDSWKSLVDSNSNIYRIGRGHLSDITSCQFFPSEEVILTTSIDMSARIYSIHPDPEKPNNPSQMLNPRTFSGPHTRSVPTASIIGKGKEIITACKDGKIRLWNVSESKVITEETILSNETADILCMKIGIKRFLNHLGELSPIPSSDDTQSKQLNNQFLAIGLSSGALHFADVPSLKPIKCIISPETNNTAIDVISISNSGELIAYATRSGIIKIFTLDWQILKSDYENNCFEILTLIPFTCWNRTESFINSLEFSYDNDNNNNNSNYYLLVAGNDGLPYRVSIHSQPKVLLEFAGFDCDPIISLRFQNQSKFTFIADQDGSISIYK